MANSGQAIFAPIMIVLGILGLINGDFTAVWQPVPKDVPARQFLAYLCALVSVSGGAGLLWPLAAPFAARLLLVYLSLWWLVFRVPEIFKAPAVQDSWSGCAETAVMVAGAWVLYVGLVAGGATGLRAARMLYGLALIPFGVAHFTFMQETAALVPGWLPFHVGWACFTGCAYIAAGVAVLVGRFAHLAAAFSALQMGMFTLMVWVPIVAAGSKNGFQWSETLLSFSLTASAWVVADSYRGVPLADAHEP